MKTYKCDACGTVIDNPFVYRMKEFVVETEIYEYGVFPSFQKRKRKVHLCGGCFNGLSFIKKVLDERERSENDG